MPAIDLPRPHWMNEDHAILADAALKFFETEFAGKADDWEKTGMVERADWEKTGEAGLLCAAMPEEYGGAGGTFAHEAVITHALRSLLPRAIARLIQSFRFVSPRSESSARAASRYASKYVRSMRA